MMEIINFTIDLVIRLPLWAMLASPLVAVLFYFAIRLHRRSNNSQATRVLFATLAGLLLAPMPVGTFMALVPNAYALFGGSNYYTTVWNWAIVSILIAALISLRVVWHYLAPVGAAFKSKPVRESV